MRAVSALASSLGRSEAFVWSGLKKIRIGMVTPDGLPARKSRRQRRYSNEIFLIRQGAGESQQTLARRLGVHRSTVRKWERGVHGPMPKNLAALGISK
jgi:DNA-binding transcriptional regulator YiaG